MFAQVPYLLSAVINLLTNPQGKNHPLVETGSLRLAVLKVPGKVYKWKEFQAMLANLSHIQWEKAQQLITNQPGVSGLAGLMKEKLILFKHLWITLLVSCLKNLIKGHSVEPWILYNLLFQHTMFTLMVSQWESIQKFVFYWQVDSIKDLHDLDMFLYGIWR